MQNGYRLQWYGIFPPFLIRYLAQLGLLLQYTKWVFTIFRVGFGDATLCLAQSRWFHGGVHREFQVIQRNSQRDKERGVIIDFREMGSFIATPCLYVSEREIPCL